ncbi:hypothetical protein TSMEX_009045, partial [Taenia solium]
YSRSPRLKYQCKIHDLCYWGEKVVTNHGVTFVIGNFDAIDLSEGLDYELRHMHDDDEAQIRICESMPFSPCECTEGERMETMKPLGHWITEFLEFRGSVAIKLKLQAEKYRVAASMYLGSLENCHKATPSQF